MTNAKSAKCPVAVFEAPKFKTGDVVKCPMGLREVVASCDLHGCTLENTARYAPERLTLIKSCN